MILLFYTVENAAGTLLCGTYSLALLQSVLLLGLCMKASCGQPEKNSSNSAQLKNIPALDSTLIQKNIEVSHDISV